MRKIKVQSDFLVPIVLEPLVKIADAAKNNRLRAVVILAGLTLRDGSSLDINFYFTRSEWPKYSHIRVSSHYSKRIEIDDDVWATFELSNSLKIRICTSRITFNFDDAHDDFYRSDFAKTIINILNELGGKWLSPTQWIKEYND